MPGSPDPAPTILLIGASRGLGLAMAAEFLTRGWNVVGTVRGAAKTGLHDLADRHPGRIEIASLDITKSDQITALRDRLEPQGFDMLFVNSGTANADKHAATMADITSDEFNEVMLTNVLGVMQAVEVLSNLVRIHGLIGVMSSGQGSIANNNNGVNDLYRCSKAALNQLMKSYAARRAGEERPLVLMAPGWIRTDLGGPNAPFTVEEAIPQVVDVLISRQDVPGLHYVTREGQTVPW